MFNCIFSNDNKIALGGIKIHSFDLQNNKIAKIFIDDPNTVYRLFSTITPNSSYTVSLEYNTSVYILIIGDSNLGFASFRMDSYNLSTLTPAWIDFIIIMIVVFLIIVGSCINKFTFKNQL